MCRVCDWIKIAIQIIVMAIFYLMLSKVAKADLGFRPYIMDTFDVIEVNHIHTEHGFSQSDQLVLWDFNGKDFQVEAWIYMKDCRQKTEEGEKKHDLLMDDYLGDIPFAGVDRAQIRRDNEYRGEYIGGPMHPTLLNGYYTVIFHDSAGHQRMVRAKRMKETWTMYDVEYENREIHPVHKRRKLTKVRRVSNVGI